MIQIIAKHWQTGEVVAVRLDGGRIAEVRPASSGARAGLYGDLSNLNLPSSMANGFGTSALSVSGGLEGWLPPGFEPEEIFVAPGLIDIQVNGFGGYDFNDPALTPETVLAAVRALAKVGVTKVMPTLVTGAQARILHCLRIIAKACGKYDEVRSAVIGIHMEGPFISEQDGPRGAHQLQYVRDPDIAMLDEWMAAAPGLVRKVTLAPEKNGAIAFIRTLRERGVIAAIGHTAASGEEIALAVEAGATMSTHLGNGAHPVIRRHPNYIWEQLAEDRLWAGFIADGFHLPRATLKAMLRAKGNKALLTSDSVNLAGMPPGEYSAPLNGQVVLEPNGLLHLKGTKDILAGAVLPLVEGVRNVVRWGLANLPEAIELAALRPAQMLGEDANGLGQLAAGSPADLILYRPHPEHILELIGTIAGGKWHGTE